MDIGGGLVGLLVLGLSIWAIINIVQSGAGTGAKVLWVLFILIIPVIGLIVWFFAGPRGSGKAGRWCRWMAGWRWSAAPLAALGEA